MNNLDFYLKPVNKRPWWVYLSVIILATFSCWAADYAYRTSVATELKLADQEKLQRQRMAALPTKPTRAQIEQQKLWKELSLERDFNWNSLFQALQTANNPGIELLEFRPEKRQGVIILRGEAKSIADLSEYVKIISKQPAFKEIYLTKQDLLAHGPLETVGFEIRGTLR